MTFEPWSFILGCLAGLVAAFLFKLHGLKKLDLSIKKLGVGLGVEGFEEPAPAGQSISVTGNQNKVAGRDLIEKVEQLHTDFAEIRQSLSQIHNHFQSDESSQAKAYLVNTIYERGDRVAEAMSRVIGRWTSQGWKLEHFTSDYSGMDGVILVFTRPSPGIGSSDVQYFHGAS
jgi:hypothetical protein